jgi:hypothetical protein
MEAKRLVPGYASAMTTASGRARMAGGVVGELYAEMQKT